MEFSNSFKVSEVMHIISLPGAMVNSRNEGMP